MDLQSYCSQDICRACLKELENNKFGLLDIQSLEKMFFACTSTEIVEDDVHTKFLCEICYDTIEKFYKFREMCIDSYTKLQNMLKEHNEGINKRTCNGLTKDIPNFVKEELKDDQKEENNLYSSSELTHKPIKEESSDNQNEEMDGNNSTSSESERDCTENKQQTVSEGSKPQKMLCCELCTKKFLKESRLHAHMRTHKGLKPYPCTECDKQFNKKYGLAVHYEVTHSNSNKLYHCTESGCDKAYKTKQVLASHVRKIHILKGSTSHTECICDTCGKVLVNKANLRKHSYIHTGELPFKCTKCPKQFTTRCKLKEHCLRHDGIKNFVCPHCGLKKTTKQELKVHLNYHTKEKVHYCPHCTSSFLNSTNLGLHIKVVHKGIRAYSCTYCDRSFGKPDTLKHHIMTHTGEKPHECKSCGKRFIQVIALQMHIKRNGKCKKKQT